MGDPLEGAKVLDLTRLLPGGYATLLMADLGADVVKVEQPDKGDYIRWSPPMVGDHSAAHIALNRNKRSMTANLKRSEGRALLMSLVESYDVLIESFRPGVMDRLGVGYEALSERNPKLVYCAISGYGQDGPRAQVAGHDANYIGYAGLLSVVGAEGERPVIPGVQIGDLAGGGMAAVIAVLAALVRRGVTGRGDFCDVSMMDGAVSWSSIHAAEFFASGAVPQRELMTLSGAFPCYRVYPAADGWLTVAALEPQFWAALCESIDRPDLLDDGFATGSRRDEVLTELESLFATKTRAKWMAHFDGLDVCVGPVNDFAEAFNDEQVQHRAMVIEADVPGAGSFKHVGNPIKFRSMKSDLLRRPPPGLGEHTDEVLEAAGIDEAARAALRAASAV
ncbi:MAG TPA: CaiB/BaiF CoA-transferase family protein [Actinomycetota bacterium]|nr:CaiB/BaiF CoA-transferase family protein [Actinomycetota bacterium]